MAKEGTDCKSDYKFDPYTMQHLKMTAGKLCLRCVGSLNDP